MRTTPCGEIIHLCDTPMIFTILGPSENYYYHVLGSDGKIGFIHTLYLEMVE